MDQVVADKKNTIYCGSISKPVAVTSGVPQDTVLGPLIFLLYVNDKQEDLECTLRLFVDDALLDHRITCETETMALQRDLDELGSWAESGQMVYNPSKCYKMLVYRSKSPVLKDSSYLTRFFHLFSNIPTLESCYLMIYGGIRMLTRL